MKRYAVWSIAIAASGTIALFTPSRFQVVPHGAAGTISVETVAVPLNTRDASVTSVGPFRYAGGLVLTSRDTDRLHGLSDIDVTAADRLIAVSDLGSMFEARLRFDGQARLVGLSDTTIGPLTNLDGQPLQVKADADAEGLALLASGDRLVSFELRDRVWLYPADGGRPRNVPAPAIPFTLNAGMEAVAADPDTGPDAYVVGIEDTGETWTCRLGGEGCRQGVTVEKSNEFGLVALRRLAAGRTAYLLRAFDLVRGNRVSLVIVRAGAEVARLNLAAPLTVDNLEGLAAVPRTDGGIRFYLVSDDNGVARQQTLLLAFDWWPT